MLIKNIIFGLIWVFVSYYFFNMYKSQSESVFALIASIASLLMVGVYIWFAFKQKKKVKPD